MSYETILYEEDGPIGTITLKPARRRKHVHGHHVPRRYGIALRRSGWKPARGSS